MEHSLYLNAIKKALKTRQVTYADLARQLRMTESGVKKMLNAKDISFRRVLQICEALDILPGQLFSMSEKSSISEVALSRSQEEALIRNRSLLAVYWRLVVEKRSLEEIETLQNLKRNELKKLLDRLVTLDLVSVTKGTYRSKHRGKFRWSDQSHLAKVLNEEWSKLTLQRALDKNAASSLHRLVSMRLSAQGYAELLKKLNQALDEAVQDSEREELTTAPQELKNFSALAAVVQKGVFDI